MSVADVVTSATGRPELVEGGISEDELTALALAADPDQPLPDTARPDPAVLDRGPLPLAYMPPGTGSAAGGGRVRTVVALLLVAAFLAITALGFCCTYGQMSFA